MLRTMYIYMYNVYNNRQPSKIPPPQKKEITNRPLKRSFPGICISIIVTYFLTLFEPYGFKTKIIYLLQKKNGFVPQIMGQVIWRHSWLLISEYFVTWMMYLTMYSRQNCKMVMIKSRPKTKSCQRYLKNGNFSQGLLSKISIK